MAFTQDELKSAIEKTLNDNTMVQIPDGHSGAFVTYVDDAGLRTAIAFKTDNGWQVDGEIAWHSDNNSIDYGINVMKTW